MVFLEELQAKLTYSEIFVKLTVYYNCLLLVVQSVISVNEQILLKSSRMIIFSGFMC